MKKGRSLGPEIGVSEESREAGEREHATLRKLTAPAERPPFASRWDGPPVIFQHVVPFPREHEPRRSRSGGKVQIGCNDLQGADLSRRLLHGSVPKPSPIDPVSMGTNGSHPPRGCAEKRSGAGGGDDRGVPRLENRETVGALPTIPIALPIRPGYAPCALPPHRFSRRCHAWAISKL